MHMIPEVFQIAIVFGSRLQPAPRRTGRLSAGAETDGTEPEQNDRRRAGGGSMSIIRHHADTARDERAFCGTEQAWL